MEELPGDTAVAVDGDRALVDAAAVGVGDDIFASVCVNEVASTLGGWIWMDNVTVV